MYPNISAIILNWNGWEDTIECLESLYQINYPNFNVIIVDNHSEDDSLEKIKEFCRGELKVESEFFDYKLTNKPIHVFEYFKDEIKDLTQYKKLNSNEKILFIKNNENYGFAEGNNIGIKFALKNFNSDYILLLNNDTVVKKDFLNKLVKVSESDEKIGICGPKTLYYHQPNVINSAGVDILWWHLGVSTNKGIGKIDKGQYDKISETDSLMGACILIKSSLIKKIGFLDKKYFILLEETDFCIRAKKAGYRILFNPKSIIYHKEGISGELTPEMFYYMYKNTLLTIRKHQKSIRLLLYGLNFSLITLTIIIYYSAKGETEASKSILNGYIQGIK
jgi:GT2 family glycosyltransferase